ALRKRSALQRAEGINQWVTELGMANARLQVEISPLSRDALSPQGLETVEFLVSPNPGQPAKPLVRIASGGELSRISLAIQVITARTSSIPTLVFDEVDVGISGATAEIVGRLLKQLASRGQILCVTHLPQVAAQGDQHL